MFTTTHLWFQCASSCMITCIQNWIITFRYIQSILLKPILDIKKNILAAHISDQRVNLHLPDADDICPLYVYRRLTNISFLQNLGKTKSEIFYKSNFYQTKSKSVCKVKYFIHWIPDQLVAPCCGNILWVFVYEIKYLFFFSKVSASPHDQMYNTI